MRLIDDDRSAVAWVKYSKPVQYWNINPYQPMGPNTLGEYLWPVEVEGNKIGLSFVRPEGL